MSERKVYVVWDGGPSVSIPPPMGTPRDDQLQGTLAEQVCELACRVCYDSLGNKRSRSTEANLQHIMQVGHLSVMEHFHRTFALFYSDATRRGAIVEALAQRPGVYWRFGGGGSGTVRITMNPRAALEWDAVTERIGFHQPGYPQELAFSIGQLLRNEWNNEAPILFPERGPEPGPSDFAALGIGSLHPTAPDHPSEVWIGLYMEGSRGFSHELVRHGNYTAISQRSTRYVNEDESPWDWHPLIHDYIADKRAVEQDLPQQFVEMLQGCEDNASEVYRTIVSTLRPWLLEKIPEGDPYRKTTARKQARGAARGFLGNALRTAVIFTANVSQWRHMMRMRAADAADAEIRLIFSEALPVLQSTPYGTMFEDLQLSAASDGIGFSLVGGGAS